MDSSRQAAIGVREKISSGTGAHSESAWALCPWHLGIEASEERSVKWEGNRPMSHVAGLVRWRPESCDEVEGCSQADSATVWLWHLLCDSGQTLTCPLPWFSRLCNGDDDNSQDSWEKCVKHWAVHWCSLRVSCHDIVSTICCGLLSPVAPCWSQTLCCSYTQGPVLSVHSLDL